MDNIFDLGYKDGENWVKRAIRLGEALGYPDCCIGAFLIEDCTTRPVRKLNGTGYVPCEKCNEKSEEELTEIINSNRDGDTKFPNSPWGKDLVYVAPTK